MGGESRREEGLFPGPPMKSKIEHQVCYAGLTRIREIDSRYEIVVVCLVKLVRNLGH